MLDELFVEDLVDDPDPIQEDLEAIEVNDQEDTEQPPANPSNPSEDAVRVAPKKRIVRKQPKIDYLRLTGPRGIQHIKSHFKNVKLRGKGYELSDLNLVMGHLALWTNRLFPKSNFDDVLDKLETLSNKKGVKTHITKIRMGWEEDPNTAQDGNLVNDEEDNPLLEPAPSRTADDIFNDLLATQPTRPINTQPVVEVTQEQKERMERNRKLALEKRLARLNAQANEGDNSLTTQID